MKKRVASLELISTLLLLFVGLIWGATFPVIKIAIQSTGALWFNAYRFLLAGILALIVLFFKKKNSQNKAKQNSGLGSYSFLLGSLLAFGYTMQTVGLAYTESGKAGFITGLFIVLVPVFAAIFFKKRISVAVYFSVFLGLIGLGLLSLGKNFVIQYGDFLVFLCAVAYAIHIVVVDRITSHYDTVYLSMSQIVVAGVLMFFLALILEPKLPVPSAYAIFALFLTSIFATILAFFIQIFAQRYLGPTKTALILLSEPVFAALFGYLLLNETFTMRKAIGSMFLLSAMVISELFGQEK